MTDGRISALTAAACLSIYWFWVVVMLIKTKRRSGKAANAIPAESTGRRMRLIWYPCIILLISALWIAALKRPEPLSADTGVYRWGTFGPLFAWIWRPSLAWWITLIPVSLIGGAATVLTFICWRKMGRSWRIGIDPREKLAIVSTGPYRYVRHPIYALRMVINLCACVMVPVPLVWGMAFLDIFLLQVEARREERYMESKHGEKYAAYRKSVGRFVPRTFVV